MRVINDMHARGYRIWYDEGIEVGSEWPECIAEHLNAAHLMLAFISDAYMQSDNCRREMHYALTKRRKVINIFLESTAMTPGMEMQIGNIFALMKYTMTEESFFNRLYSAPLLNSENFADTVAAATAPQSAIPLADTPPQTANAPDTADRKAQKRAEKAAHKAKKKATKDVAKLQKVKKKGRAGKIVALVLLLVMLVGAVTMGVIGHFTGWNERLIVRMNTPQMELTPTGAKADFSSDVFEYIARDYTGITTGDIYVSDLASLAELHIVGANYYTGVISPDNCHALPENASVRELGDLKYFTGLRTLGINDHALSTLATMPALPLQSLDISGCRVASLEGIGRLTKLRELNAAGCPAIELGDINRCLDLRLVDLTGAGVTDFGIFKPLTKLTTVALSGCTTSEMRTILRHSSLTDVCFTTCDLRGNFFKSFDRETAIVSMTLDNCKLDSTVNLDDFSSLSSLTLLSTGEALDWSILEELSSLVEVNIDLPMQPTIDRALQSNTQITVNLITADN